MFTIYLLTPIVDKYFPKSFSPNGIKYRFEVYIIKVHMNIMLFLCFSIIWWVINMASIVPLFGETWICILCCIWNALLSVFCRLTVGRSILKNIGGRRLKNTVHDFEERNRNTFFSHLNPVKYISVAVTFLFHFPLVPRI